MKRAQPALIVREVFLRTHPNLILIEPASAKDDEAKGLGVIKIDQIRELIVEMGKANFESGIGVLIITHMHQTTKSAANALLKVMEETKSNKVFLALAPSRTAVLPTIASRLVVHHIAPNLANYWSKDTEWQKRIFAISTTPLFARLPMCEQFSADRETLMAELQDLATTCHVLLRTKEAPPRFILQLREAIDSAAHHLKLNVNPRLVILRLVLREWPLISK